MTETLRMTVEPDGSVSAISGSVLEETVYTGVVAETVVYPECQRGEPDGYGHWFVESHSTSEPLLFCQACGLIQRLEVPS